MQGRKSQAYWRMARFSDAEFLRQDEQKNSGVNWGSNNVKFYFESAEKEPEFYALDKITTYDKDHGRIEKRQYFLETKVDWLENREECAGLNAIRMVKSTRLVKGNE